jgi:transcriptional regulator with XRE-family HTH domain
MELHDQIKKEREKQGISKYKLSRIINTNESYYGTLEKGKHSPSLDMMKRICIALDITITISPDGVKIK